MAELRGETGDESDNLTGDENPAENGGARVSAEGIEIAELPGQGGLQNQDRRVSIMVVNFEDANTVDEPELRARAEFVEAARESGVVTIETGVLLRRMKTTRTLMVVVIPMMMMLLMMRLLMMMLGM